MAIEQGIWKIGKQPQKLQPVTILSESLLEEQIIADISILNPDWMIIGQQVRTAFDKCIDLFVFSDFENKCLNELQTEGNYQALSDLDDDNAEYLVLVKWLDTKPINDAFSETGLFGNQNTVCKPTTPKWSHTIERLKSKFQI